MSEENSLHDISLILNPQTIPINIIEVAIKHVYIILHSVQDIFRSKPAIERNITRPVLVGAMSVTSGALYTIKVEILQTAFGVRSGGRVEISINDNDYGTCAPTCNECCTWFTCTLSTTDIVPSSSTAAIRLQYFWTTLYPGTCNNQEEARITLNLKG